MHTQIQQNTDTQGQMDMGTKSQDSLQTGTDSDSYNRRWADGRQGDESREFQSVFAGGPVTPQGGALISSVRH